jgi:hypothetical protein
MEMENNLPSGKMQRIVVSQLWVELHKNLQWLVLCFRGRLIQQQHIPVNRKWKTTIFHMEIRHICILWHLMTLDNIAGGSVRFEHPQERVPSRWNFGVGSIQSWNIIIPSIFHLENGYLYHRLSLNVSQRPQRYQLIAWPPKNMSLAV